MPKITITLTDNGRVWEVSKTISRLTPYTLDWLIDQLQEKLNKDPKGRKYLSD